MTTRITQMLYAQTLFNRGAYAHNSNKLRELVQEMIDTLVNIGSIDRNIAKEAFRDRLKTVYFNKPRCVNSFIKISGLQENEYNQWDYNEKIITVPRANSLIYQLRKTSIAITTIVLYLLYRWLK